MEELKNKIISNTTNIFKGRILKISNITYNSNYYQPEYYLIDNISIVNNNINCIKLYDKNGIKINIDYYIKNSFYYTISFNNIKENINNINIFSPEESQEILNDHKKNQSVLKIFYYLTTEFDLDLHEDKEKSLNNKYIRQYSFKSPAKKLIFDSIKPDDLNNKMDEYFIDNNAGIIFDVKNKEENLKVIYSIEELKTNSLFDYLEYGLSMNCSIYEGKLNVLFVNYLNKELLNIKEINVINYNFSLDQSYQINLSRVKNFEDQYINSHFNSYKFCSLENESILIMIKDFKIRRIIAKFKGGNFKEYKGELLFLNSYSLMKLKLIEYQENYESLKYYQNSILRLNKLPIKILIEQVFFNYENYISPENTLFENIIDGINNMNINNKLYFNTENNCDAMINNNQELSYNKTCINEGESKIKINKIIFNNSNFIECYICFDNQSKFINFFYKKELYFNLPFSYLEKLEKNLSYDFEKILFEKENIYNLNEIKNLFGIKTKIDEKYNYYIVNTLNLNVLSLLDKDYMRKEILEDLENIKDILYFIRTKNLWEFLEVIFYIFI